MARLDPDGAFRGAEVGPRAAADGDGQAGPGRAEREYRRCALFRVQRIGDRAGELPPVAALSGDLLKQVKQVVGGLALLQAAEQDKVAVSGQNSVARNGEQAGRVLAHAMLGHTSLPP